MNLISPTVPRRPMHPGKTRPIVLALLAWLLWLPPSWAQTLLDIHQTGAELAANPEVVFHQSPTVVGESIDLMGNGESFLFEWPLLPSDNRRAFIVEITVNFTPLSDDSDPTFGIHDLLHLAGYLRSDNSGGALFRREGFVSGQDLPTLAGPFGPTGLDPVEPFTMSYVVANNTGPTSFEFMEGADRFTDEFEDHPLDGDLPIVFFMGGGNDATEHYRLHSLSIQIREAPSTPEALVYFPLTNCSVVDTMNSSAEKLSNNEVRHFIVRGETTNLSSQGGSDSGCGVPQNAEAIAANFLLSEHDGDGVFRVGATGKSLGGAGTGTLIAYDSLSVDNKSNATILDLCDNDTCTSDFRVHTKGSGSATHLVVDVMGYFAPPILGAGGGETRSLETPLPADRMAAEESSADVNRLYQQVRELERRNQDLEEALGEIKRSLGLR